MTAMTAMETTCECMEMNCTWMLTYEVHGHRAAGRVGREGVDNKAIGATDIADCAKKKRAKAMVVLVMMMMMMAQVSRWHVSPLVRSSSVDQWLCQSVESIH